jgi:HK97 family phage major capsid protein
MSNARQRLEAAVKSLQEFSDQLDAADAPLSGEDMSNLKSRMEEIKDLKGQVEAEAEAAGALKDAKAFMAALTGDASGESAKGPSLTVTGLPMDTQGKTFGEMFVESDSYKDFIGRYAGRDGIIPSTVKGLQSGPFSADVKALVTGASSTSGGAFVVNDRYGPTIDLVGERELTVYDLVTKGSTASDTVEYVRVTGKTNNAAPVAEATTAAAPTAPGTAGALVLAAGGGYKPESGLDLEVVSTTVKTIAHWLPITKRAASDAGQIRTLIDNFLRYGLNEELEDQMLTGSGSGENFTGILNSGISTVGSAGTDIDAIVDAIRTVRVTGRRRPNASGGPPERLVLGRLPHREGLLGQVPH